MESRTISKAAAVGSDPAAQIARHFRTPLFRNAYALIFSSATTSILGIAYWALAARFYSAEVLGQNSAAIAATLLLSAISILYLDGAFIRFIPRAGRATGRLITFAYLITSTVAAVVSITFILGVHIWSPALAFLQATPWSIIWFVLATMTGSVFLMQDGALTGLRQAVWVPIENTTYAIAKIILLLLFSTSFGQYGIFASWTIPAAILILPVNWLIFRRLLSRHHQATDQIAAPISLVQIRNYVTGNYVGVLFLMGYTRLLPILVINLAGDKASAYFYLPWLIATSLQLVAQNMSVSLVVEGAINQGKLGNYVRRGLIGALRLLVPVVIVLVVAAPLILRVFGPDYAAGGTDLLRLFSLAIIPNTFFVMVVGLLRVQRRIGRVVLMQAVVACAVLILSYVLLPIYGITGVGLAWLACQTAMAILLFLIELKPMFEAE